MKIKALNPVLPALILPFLALPLSAQQMTGISHPDQLNDGITTPAQADHYTKSPHTTGDSAAAPAPIVQTAPPVATRAAAPAYQDSFPATAPAASPEPVLITRQPASVPPAPAPVQYAPYNPHPEETAGIVSATPAEGNDNGIVLEVPTRPHELNPGTLLKARLRETIDTRAAKPGTIFTAELLSDIGHHGEVMLPAGSLIRGRVSSIHGGRRITGGAAIHLETETVSLPDGTLYNLRAQVTGLDSAEDVRVNGEGTVVTRSHPKTAAAVIVGVTATSAVAGAVVGGGVGAALGATIGAGVATTVWLKHDVQEMLPEGARLIFALDQTLIVTPH